MQDIKWMTKCNHRVTGEILDIKPVKGEKNKYIATLPYGIIPIKAQTFIRSYNAEKEYLANLKDYTLDLNYSYEQLPKTINSVDLPISGIIKKIGITNYEFTDSHTITFGVEPLVDGEPFIQYDPGLIPQPVYLIDCYVEPVDCPICKGTNITQDINYTGRGDLQLAEGHQKLIQRVLKTLLTSIGQSPEDVYYGSGLDELIGSEINNGLTISLQKAIYESVQYLISIQEAESLTLSETCTGISNIKVEQSEANPADLLVTITIFDGEKNEVPCSLVLHF